MSLRFAPASAEPAPASLARYDAAVRALAEAKSVDEVKDLRDKAEAMRAYARQAKNKQLETDAAEIRIRAERRLGELIAGQKATVGMAKGGQPYQSTGSKSAPVERAATLAEAGIDKKLSARAQKMAAVPEAEFESMVGEWRERAEAENERVTTNLLKAGERAEQGRRENDFYPTPESLIAQVVGRWKPRSRIVWEPCAGDGRIVAALQAAGFETVRADIAQGQDFFASDAPLPDIALCTNPPFERVREFIDHAFAIGIHEMCLVLPERIWASGIGREQFERHRPAVWANLDWREDYLGKGGSPDRALAVAIWNSPCAACCEFQVWTREESPSAAQDSANPEQADVARSAERASSAVEIGATNSPERANRIMSMTPLQPREANGLKGFGFTVTFDDPNSSAPTSSPEKTDKAGAAVTPPASAPAAKFKTLSKADQIRLLRPNCKHADDLAKCGGNGRRHCRDCMKDVAVEVAE